jgi:hypothetical protein
LTRSGRSLESTGGATVTGRIAGSGCWR